MYQELLWSCVVIFTSPTWKFRGSFSQGTTDQSVRKIHPRWVAWELEPVINIADHRPDCHKWPSRRVKFKGGRPGGRAFKIKPPNPLLLQFCLQMSSKSRGGGTPPQPAHPMAIYANEVFERLVSYVQCTYFLHILALINNLNWQLTDIFIPLLKNILYFEY